MVGAGEECFGQILLCFGGCELVRPGCTFFGTPARARVFDLGIEVIGAGSDLDEDAAGLAIGVDAGEGMMVERHLNSGVFGGALDAGFDVAGDANVDVLGASNGRNHDGSEQQAQGHGS